MSGRKQVRAVVLAALLVLSTFSVVGVGAATASTGNTTDSTFHVSQNGQCYSVSALGNGDQTVEEFYDYRSNETENQGQWSSYGTTDLQDNQESKLFLYHGSNGYSLVILHDKYPNDGGDGSHASTTTFTLSGLPDGGEWVVKDDTYADGSQDDNWDTSGNDHKIDWKWASDRNDGGAYLGVGDAEITIDPAFNEDATAWGSWPYSGDDDNKTAAWKLIDGDKSEHELDMNESLTVAQGDCSDDTEPSTGPTVESFTVESSNNETVDVSILGSASISDIEVEITDENDTPVATLTEKDFTTSDGGDYVWYDAAANAESSASYTATLLKAADDDGNDAADGQTGQTYVGPVEGSIEYENASTAVVTGEFEEVFVQEHWHNQGGLNTDYYSLKNVSGTTTITTSASGGMNGTAIAHLAAKKHAGDGETDLQKENPYRDNIVPHSLNISVANVAETGDGVYDVTFAYENANDQQMWVKNSEFVTGNVAEQPPEKFDTGENGFTVTWTPAANDERVTLEVNQSNFELDDVSTSTEPASEYGGASGVEDGSPTAQIESGDWAHKNSGAHFDGSNSTDDGEIVSYEWEFSDGGNATGAEVDHFYNSTGEHTATLTVTDDDGNTDSETVSIEIREEDVTKPDASVTASPKTVETGETVTFDGSDSSDESGIAQYHWDFDGDSEFDRTTDKPTTTYTFSEPGEHEVVMGAEDDGDNALIGTDTVTVTVTESSSEPPTDGGPTAKLSLTKQTADFDQKVGFNASASTDDGSIAEYRWDFDGDGDVDRKTPDNATGKHNPAHTVWHEVYKLYDEPGTYTATVTVADDDGHTDTATAEITIKEDAQSPSATLHVPEEATVGEEVTMEATDFTEDDLAHVCWVVDGDHDKPEGAVATHTFEKTGEHDVTLHIRDKAGNSVMLSETITITAADDGSDGPSEDPNDPSEEPPENGLDDDPNEGNTGGDLPSASPPQDTSNDDSNDDSNDGDRTPKKAAFNGTEGTYGEIVLRTDATDATVEVTETVPDEMRQPTVERDGFEALSYVTVSGDEEFEATFTVSKDRLESLEASSEDVTLFEFGDGSWNAVETEQLNETDDAFQFGANATNGTYAVGIDAPSTAVEDLRVASNRVAPGDEVTVTATVENDGRASGTQDVALTVDGETVATKSVSVEADSTAEVEFTQSFDAPGVYAVSAGDANAEIVVEGIETTETDDDSESATTTATETADDSSSNVPGFGVGAALVALAAAALLARRQA